MTDYTRTDERLVFTERMQRVKADIHPRLRCRNDREDSHTEQVSTHGLNPFVDEFESHPDTPYIINLANAIVRSWLVTEMVIYPHEAIVGILRPSYPVMEHFHWGIIPRGEEHYARFGYAPEEKARADRMARRLEPLDWPYFVEAACGRYGEAHYRAIKAEKIFSAGGYQGHTIPNYPTLLELGLDGVLEKIDFWAEKNVRDAETADFYEANRIIVRGMSAYLAQYAAYAASLAAAESDPTQARYYREIAENCAYVAHKKPETLYQAIQLMWCLSLWDWVDCLGRVDQYLYPFYRRSVEQGDVITAEEAITSLMFKIWEGGSHNSTLSGCKPSDGSDATNELTYLFLQILRNIHDSHPRMVVRIREDAQPALSALIVKLWSEGMCDPTVVSDVNVIPALERLGVPLTDARDYATLGCQEIEIPGKSNTGCEDGSLNLAKLLELTLRGGKNAAGVQLGPETTPLVECESFAALYAAFATQVAYFTEMHCWLCSRGQEIRAANHAKLVKGPFTDGVLERGIDHDAGGPIYGYGVIETAGVAAAADSLTAIQKLVYDEGRLSRETLMAALDADFVGYERERQLLLNRAPKFGNDDPDADAMAVRVLNTYWDEIAKYRSVRGGVYTGACSLLTGGISYGEKTGALPDGRCAREPLGNTIGPRPGADRCGVTAMLASVAKLPLHKGVGGTTVNVTLPTKMMATPEQRQKVAAMIHTFMRSGGQMAQISTANLADLLDAKAHPDRHGDLLVRVGGYSMQFVQLNEKAQNEIISRYTEEAGS